MRFEPLMKLKQLPLRKHWLVFGAVCAAAYLFLAHTDIVEIASHSYVFVDSIFKGRVFDYYSYVAEHPFGTELYYINVANYNITTYAVFGVALLPVYLFNMIFGTYSEPVFYFVCKLVSAGFFVGCAVLVRKIALELKLDERSADFSALFFSLSPVAFFSSMMMAQYDCVPLFFALLGLLYWLRGDLTRCLFWMGLGAACKFFVLFLVVPLVLLKEKRILHIIKNGLISLWLIVPTTLLYLGRTGNSSDFNLIMINRLFEIKLPAVEDVSLFVTLYLILCVLAFLWAPEKENENRAGLWTCLAGMALFALFVNWHPQWLIMLVPFIVLSTMLEHGRTVWWWLDIALAAGFFLMCFVRYPVEGNLFDFGIMGAAFDIRVSDSALYQSVSTLFHQFIFRSVGPVLLCGALLCNIVLKFPAKSGTPASRLAVHDNETPARLLPLYAWGIFVAGILVWLAPTLMAWLPYAFLA
jgi:hypothetical protein